RRPHRRRRAERRPGPRRIPAAAARRRGRIMTGYRVRRPFATRWRDNDQYGHLNNVVYYEAMDTAVNAWMIAEAGLDPAGRVIAIVVSSSCEYRESASFPELLEVGIGVERLGTTSVTWALGILRPGVDE